MTTARRSRSSESSESDALLSPPPSSSEAVPSKRWFGEWVAFYKNHLSVELDNSKGSVARDHLANERTYLAWLRTSLSFASAGVGVTQLLRLNTVDDHDRYNERAGRLRKLGKPAGATLVTLALLVICFGSLRYFRIQEAMQQNKFPASRIMVAFLSLITVVILLAGVFILVVLSSATVH